MMVIAPHVFLFIEAVVRHNLLSLIASEHTWDMIASHLLPTAVKRIHGLLFFNSPRGNALHSGNLTRHLVRLASVSGTLFARG